MNFWKMVTVSAIGFYNKSTERFVSLFTYKVVLCKEWLYKQHFNDNFCLRKKSVILALLSDCRYKERRKNNKSILKKVDVFISLPCSDAVERKDLNLHHSFSMGSFCVLKQSHLTPVSAVLQLKKKKGIILSISERYPEDYNFKYTYANVYIAPQQAHRINSLNVK